MVKESKMPKYVETKTSITYEEIINKLPHGAIITVGEIRDYFAKVNSVVN